MGLPSKRRTSRSKRERHAHISAKTIGTTVCPKCQGPIRPHHACANCGYYRGRQAVNTKKRAERALRHAKHKQ